MDGVDRIPPVAGATGFGGPPLRVVEAKPDQDRPRREDDREDRDDADPEERADSVELHGEHVEPAPEAAEPDAETPTGEEIGLDLAV